MVFDIRYKITLVIDNLITNNLDRLSKSITRRNITLETGIPVEIDKKNILDYFTREINVYCADNHVNKEDLTVDGYEIQTMPTTRANGIYVYFKSEDLASFSFEPSIMAVLQHLKEMPELHGEQVSNTAIKWYWDTNNTVNRLIDQTGKLIAECSLGVNFYIENNLTPGGTYTRKLTAKDDFENVVSSNEASITLLVNKAASVYTKYKVPDRNEDIEPINTDFCSKLKAFASGIGDDEDCKLYKADDSTFNRQFTLINRIYGVRASNEIKHHTIKFHYRYKLEGLVDYLTYDAKFTVKITAQECVDWWHDPDTTLYGAPMVCEKPLTYLLDDNTQVANIFVEQFFPTMAKNYKKRYKFTIEIYNTSGESRAYMRDRGFHNILNGDTITFSEKGHFDHKFTIAGIAVKRQKKYEEWYPGLDYEPLVGAVNGDFEITPDGLKDMTDTMNTFEFSPSVYDKKYYCVFEDIQPSSAYVNYKFDHQTGDNNFTETNGDVITFSSKSIFPDESEHKEFITQTENGPYLINNSKINRFHYEMKDIQLDLAAYKRFELEVTASSSEITILDYPKEPLYDITGLIDMQIDVACRNLQSAIAKWSPIIHNGYYYYNQHEYFLYSKCTPNGQNMVMEDMFAKSNIMVKLVADEMTSGGTFEEYHFNLKTKEELLLDGYHYEWFDNKVWPLPMEVYNDYYMEFASVYEYYTQPFTFDNAPTEYTNFSWDEDGTSNGSILEAYAIAYDDVYGKWYSPVRIYNGRPIPSELRGSKVIVLKFILKPSRKPKLQKRAKLFSCEADWKNNENIFLSNNIYFLEESLVPTSYLVDGVYISKFMDMGDTADSLKERSIRFDGTYTGTVKFFVKQADTKAAIEDEYYHYNDWEEVPISTTKTDLKRFVRWMVIVSGDSKLYHMTMTTERYEYTGMARREYLPGFGNIKVDAKYSPSAIKHSYENVLTMELPFDAKDHVLIESLDEYLQKMADAQGFNKADVTRVNLYPYDKNNSDFTITKNLGTTDSTGTHGDTVTVKSKTAVVDKVILENNQSGASFSITDNKLEMTPIPQQFSPVILQVDGEDEPYTQVFFTNEKGEYILDTTEEFDSWGFATLYLKYLNLDAGSVRITIDGTATTDYTISNNIIIFKDKIPEESKISVTYRIKNSFIVNYDFETDTMSLEIYKDGNMVTTTDPTTEKEETKLVPNPVEKCRIYYETNKLSAFRQLTNISLNPIYNGRFNGFIYICDYQDPPQYIDVFPSYDFIFANGKDDMNVIVQVTDKNGNPVENVKVNITCAAGRLDTKNEVTDINGIIHCTYTSTTENCIDKVLAIVSDTVKGEAKIINRKL